MNTSNVPYFFRDLFDLQSQLQSSSRQEANPLHPVQSALSLALKANTKAMLAIVAPALQLSERGDVGGAWEIMDAALCSDAGLRRLFEARELHKYLFPDEPLSQESAESVVKDFVTRGFRITDLIEHVRNDAHRERRRPRDLKIRQAHIEGFELMLLGKQWSFARSRRELCKRGFPVTSDESLRAGIRELKKILRQHAPELVTQFESLHPNRAIKSQSVEK